MQAGPAEAVDDLRGVGRIAEQAAIIVDLEKGSEAAYGESGA